MLLIFDFFFIFFFEMSTDLRICLRLENYEVTARAIQARDLRFTWMPQWVKKGIMKQPSLYLWQEVSEIYTFTLLSVVGSYQLGSRR